MAKSSQNQDDFISADRLLDQDDKSILSNFPISSYTFPQVKGRYNNRFVVHKHFTQKAGLHYDFRLQQGKIMRSWVLSETPPVNCGERCLAIPVDDHTLTSLDFSGFIQSGRGIGQATIWDQGFLTWKHKEGRLQFELRGKYLRGTYILTPCGENFFLEKTIGTLSEPREIKFP